MRRLAVPARPAESAISIADPSDESGFARLSLFLGDYAFDIPKGETLAPPSTLLITAPEGYRGVATRLMRLRPAVLAGCELLGGRFPVVRGQLSHGGASFVEDEPVHVAGELGQCHLGGGARDADGFVFQKCSLLRQGTRVQADSKPLGDWKFRDREIRGQYT
jgi:hypothetical protein